MPLIAGRYRLGDPLGEGGMGRVWHARDEVLQRDVAVKEVLLPDELLAHDRGAAHRRTLREARAAARLGHPNVVQVFDVLDVDGRAWIVMAYVPSRSLHEELKESGPLDPRRAAKIGLDLLAALRAAHSAGVDHRDVKPANVLLADDGRVLLTDFGIATIEGDNQITSSNMLLGSPEYMSPERAKDGTSGLASDLWSLGATLYAAVEGRSPFRRANALATLTALAADEPDPPQKAGPLEPLLVGLLRKNPAERLDANEVEHLLRAAASGAYGHALVPARDEAPTTDDLILPSVRGGAAVAAAPSSVRDAPAPAPAREAEPAPSSVREAEPAPAPVREAEPAPAPVREAEAAPVGEAAPAPVREAEPAPVREVQPAPVREADPARSRDVEAEPVREVQAAPAVPRQRSPERVPSAAPPLVAPPSDDAPESEPPRARGVTSLPPQPPEVASRPSASPIRRWVVVAVAVVVIALAAVVWAVARSGNDESRDPVEAGQPPASAPVATTPTSAPAETSRPSSSTAATSAAKPPPSSPAANGSTRPPLPAGWRDYRDPTGFAVYVPEGWNRSQEGSIVYFRDSRTGRVLGIDQTDTPHPNPVADWQGKAEYRVSRGDFPSYREIRIVKVGYFRKAADWEFTFTRNGTRQHVNNRGVVTSNRQAYGFYWQTRDADWKRYRPDLQLVFDSFRPAT